MEAEVDAPVRAKLKKERIHPKQILINHVEKMKHISWNLYETSGFYNIEITGASEPDLNYLILTKPMGVMFHISFQTQKFEFFIDKDFKNDEWWH